MGGCIMFRRNLVPILILLLICFFILKPATVSEGAFNGLKIWVNNIIPFLFPMSVLSNILLKYNFIYRAFEKFSFISEKILKNKYAMIPYFISFVSGYPSGAMSINTMLENKRINGDEANYLIPFTNNCSFQFIVGALAYSMLNDFSLFKFIAIPHFTAAIILSFCIKNKTSYKIKKNIIVQAPVTFHQAFSLSIYKSIISILSVGGVIVIFSVFSNFFNDTLTSLSTTISLSSHTKDIIYSLIVGALELTNGCSIISSSSYVPLELKLIIINFLVSFSGMSVIFQTIAVTEKFELDITNYILYKFILGIISVLICILMLNF